MNSDSEEDKPSVVDQVINYFRILMTLVYVAVGVAIIVGPIERFNIPAKYALPLGSLLIAYGLFRSYKLLRYKT